MLDTIKLRSPYLSESDAERIERSCVLRQAVEIKTGDVQYSFTSGLLAGSFDDRVSVRVMREEVVSIAKTAGEVLREAGMSRRSAGRCVPVPCDPYVLIEGSVHKALIGHNVHGGPLEPLLAACWFVDDISSRLEVSLPYAEDWTVQRIDWAEAYELPSFVACEEYIRGLNMAEFPRRQVYRYGAESVMSPGRTTAVKAYHKGPEFYKHDRKRLQSCLTDGEVFDLQERANRILRFETSIKARKLAEDHEGKPLVVQITRDYLEGVHDRETARLLKEASSEMETVRTHVEVSRRLQELYSRRQANSLFGTWMQLSALGERQVRHSMKSEKGRDRTFQDHIKKLKEAGCSWHAADVQIVPRCSEIPHGFSPVRLDPRRLVEEAEGVRYKLQSYDRAA